MDIINNLFSEPYEYVFIAIIIILTIYIATSMFLNKFNKLIYGKGTPMAWIPILNIYLLGKLAINKLVGWILILCILSTGKLTVTVNDASKTYTLLPENIKSKVSSVYALTVFILLIYSIIKYNKIKKESSIEVQIQQPAQQEQVYQQPINNEQTNQNSTNNNI